MIWPHRFSEHSPQMSYHFDICAGGMGVFARMGDDQPAPPHFVPLPADRCGQSSRLGFWKVTTKTKVPPTSEWRATNASCLHPAKEDSPTSRAPSHALSMATTKRESHVPQSLLCPASFVRQVLVVPTPLTLTCGEETNEYTHAPSPRIIHSVHSIVFVLVFEI